MHLFLAYMHFFFVILQSQKFLKKQGVYMRFISMIVWALLILLAIYYITVIAHLFTNMFGKNIDFAKTLIPFYGWKIWFENF